MPEPNGHNVLLLDTLEINPIVDHVGLTEPLKLIMIDCALNLDSILFYLLLILLLVVDSSVVSHKDVMEDKLELHGAGLPEPELLLEETLVILPLAIHILCKNVLIMLLPHYQTVALFKKMIQLVEAVAQEIQLHTAMINTKLHHHMD